MRFESGLSRALSRLKRDLPTGIRSALQEEKPRFQREVGAFMQARTLEVFDGQHGPNGEPWPKLGFISRAIRRHFGFGGTKAGIGPNKTLRNSWKIGNAYNIFRWSGWRFFYGSKLRRGGVRVADSFQEQYRFPNSEETRRPMAAFILFATGIYAPRKGTRWTHRARKILGMPESYRNGLQKIARAFIQRAIARAVRKAR